MPNENAGLISQVDPNDVVIPDTALPDSVWNYELGMKATWLDGRLKTNIAAYYIPWQDIQLQAQRVSDGSTFQTNAGKAVSKGVELEMQAWPTDALELGMNLTFQNAKITDLTTEEEAITGALEGQKLVSPDFQISGYVQYRWMLENGHEMYARLDAQHVGSYPSGFPYVAGSPGVTATNVKDTEAYENVNASIGWETDSLRVIFYGENILNNDNYVYISPSTTTLDNYTTLRPRTVGIRASWKY